MWDAAFCVEVLSCLAFRCCTNQCVAPSMEFQSLRFEMTMKRAFGPGRPPVPDDITSVESILWCVIHHAQHTGPRGSKRDNTAESLTKVGLKPIIKIPGCILASSGLDCHHQEAWASYPHLQNANELVDFKRWLPGGDVCWFLVVIWYRWPYLDMTNSIAKEFLGGLSSMVGKSVKKAPKAHTRRARNIAQYLITMEISWYIILLCFILHCLIYINNSTRT